MDTLVWQNVWGEFGDILALTGDSICHYNVDGKNAVQQASEVSAALRSGQDPASITAKKAILLPLASIVRVEVSHGRNAITALAGPENKTTKLKFIARKEDDVPAIARIAIDRAGLPYGERLEKVGIGTALLLPFISGAIALWLWSLAYYVAWSTLNGREEDINRKGRGAKQLILLIADTIGLKGVIILGVILLVGFLGWMLRRITHRPQRLVWAPPAT
jgi:hypothetical protein